MAGYSNNFNDELRARLSIVDIVGRKVPLVKKGQNFWGCCPFHNEKTPSFSVNEQKGFYHCFGCGEHGDIIGFTMKTQNMGYVDAIKELANLAGLKMPDFKPKTPEQAAREQTFIEIMTAAAKTYADALFSPAGAGALEYIRKRGFSDEVIKKYGLGYAPKNNTISAKFATQKEQNLIATGLVRRGDYGLYDFFRNRLMFPIFNPNGQTIAFSGRSLDGSEPKYINTSDTELFHKRRTIFGLNFARDAIYKANRSIVVEGQIDAIQMQTHGFSETVAPLGTALTEEHLQILCKSNRNITFCFDGDGAGQKAAARAADLMMPLLRDTSDVRFAFVPSGQDPDEILKNTKQGTELMEKIIDSATPIVDFLWGLANKNYLTQTPGGRASAEKFLQTEIEKITDPNLKNEYKQEYSQRKFNEWHKWKKADAGAHGNAPVPNADALTRKTLSEVAATYPELIEKYAEFLAKIGMGFSENKSPDLQSPLSQADAEKFIVSLKLKNYLEMLRRDKKNIMAKMLASKESDDQSLAVKLKTIDEEIKKACEKTTKLADI
ncbi:MAG: DNA primase [Rickettsiales bacterium]|jgi:DNA primase|nr:DNA primase [Rickettsiales bacterium]